MKTEKTTRQTLPWLLTALCCLTFAACVHLERPFPEKQFYLMDAARNDAPALQRNISTIRIRRFNISPYCKREGFVYRLGKFRYESDFYNEFFVAPDILLTQQTEHWFEDAGLFHAVLPEGSAILSDYILEGNIVQLHGDFRKNGPAKAVLAIQFMLMSKDPAVPGAVFHKRYAVETDLEGRSPGDLVKGWNASLVTILGRFEADLARELLMDK